MKKKMILYILYLMLLLFCIFRLYVFFIRIVQEKEAKINKFEAYFHLLDRWLALKQEKGSIAEALTQNGYKTVAVYGMGALGKRLCRELADSECEVKYVLDRNTIASNELQLTLEDELPKVDAVIVTPICEFHEIEKKLRLKVQCPIVSLGKLLY